MASRSKLVLAPASFLSSKYFDELRRCLSKLSYDSVALILPSCNAGNPFDVDAVTNVDFMHSQLQSLLNKGDRIYLVTHSYSTVAGFDAACRLSRAERRRKAEQGGIVGTLAISGIPAKVCLTCVQLMGGKYLSYAAYKVWETLVGFLA